ncbi:3'-5' exoribonuclease YhaM family protein [Butyrivibrio sp. YAB3001]|uniref:3'-5' exoribonuclease YhaM family protein n=1 Tax=Butyrivibrio sp. YAB3001 TaxID=1520812 RepID=UPI0008F6247B|nr:HD domain-containing protein [Butyrivibrio sp. YAB3001]SFC10563.1 3'-5' exoribonuclease [Butyrivibrio sp. YAB3001]
MKFIKDLKPGDRINDVYLCKHKVSATTKNGKEYFSVILQDKTGTIDAKIWEPNSNGIYEFDATDYINIFGEVTSFNGALQVSIKSARKCQEGEYDPTLYLPVTSKNVDEMYKELLGIIGSIQNPYLKKLLEDFFIHDEKFIVLFKKSSAAKTVHHGFIGGLLEHTLSVTKLCMYYCTSYPKLNRDLLLTAAICHDIGKTRELSLFPTNDYTDEGQFLGHIVMGTEMIGEKARNIQGFPELLKQELQHCILAHHGEFEYGSPKKPAIMEAVALNLADNTDAKMETFTELLSNVQAPGWQGYNKFFESNIYETVV